MYNHRVNRRKSLDRYAMRPGTVHRVRTCRSYSHHKYTVCTAQPGDWYKNCSSRTHQSSNSSNSSTSTSTCCVLPVFMCLFALTCLYLPVCVYLSVFTCLCLPVCVYLCIVRWLCREQDGPDSLSVKDQLLGGSTSVCRHLWWGRLPQIPSHVPANPLPPPKQQSFLSGEPGTSPARKKKLPITECVLCNISYLFPF